MEQKRKSTKQTLKKLPKRIWGNTALSVALMIIWVGASVIVSQLVVGYSLLWILGTEKFQQPVWTAIYSALSYILTFVLIIFVPRRNSDRTSLGLKNSPTWTDIGLAPVGFIVYLLIAAALVWVFSIFPWFNPEETQEIGFNLYATGVDRIIAFITLVVLAPIAEELIFRGWLYGKLREKLSEKVSNNASMLISIFLVSLLFGIIHLQWNVGVNVFALSIVLCGLREITGTIYAGILLHMIKNGVALYLLYQIGL